MTRSTRAWLGAIFGAFFVILIYPQARAYWFAGLPFPSRPVTLLPLIGDRPKPPTDEVESAAWLLSGAARLSENQKLTGSERESLVGIAQRESLREPTNAFWNQMLAILASPTEARDYWMRAANSTTYNDYQSDAVARGRVEYLRRSGASMGWHAAALFAERRSEGAVLTQRLASQLAGASPKLALRLSILENGRLLRDGGRSLAAARIGVALVEGASYPPSLRRTGDARRLLLARTEMVQQLRKSFPSRVQATEDVFRANDAWLAMTGSDEPGGVYRSLGWGSLATAVLPGALTITACLGAGLWLLISLHHRFQPLAGRRRGLTAFLLAAALAWGAWATTHLWLPACAAALCALFLLYEPRQLRARVPDSLGPLFEILVAVLATSFVALITAYVAGLSGPALILLPELDAPGWSYGGAASIAGLAVLTLGSVCLIAPLFAVAQRISTSEVFDRALRQFGANVTLIAATCAMVGLPVAMIVDQRLRQELTQIAENEPLYHYNRWFRVQ